MMPSVFLCLPIAASSDGAFFGQRVQLRAAPFPDVEKAINYRVPALIEATVEQSFISDSYYRCYRIKHFDFSSGNRVYFSDHECLEINSIVEVVDDDDRTWGIEMTTIAKKQ